MNPNIIENGAIMAEILITAQNNEKMPITVTVPTTLLFPLHGHVLRSECRKKLQNKDR
jgi:hypothetical protein